ncbi:hypothetical protein MPRF_37850 [Mycolicibacterium parafortuitum]|uniref:Uncharacterized protein n=1 Tax=Mycolicibacterium parafortuitum TaxID=39692 RepID=A0A7I7U975_MYCPF|nr:hypothetical protein MPRF_37850 [Mycolicibacterium parafortuitum]
MLDAQVARYLAAVEAPMAVTPWRSMLLFDLEEEVADVALRVLAPLGLIFDENSPWLSVSACTGSPGCAQSAADVRADAAAAVDPAVPGTGTSSGANAPAAVRHTPRSWWRPETATGAEKPTRRVIGCSTTSATPRRSIASRSRPSVPRRIWRGSPRTWPAWWCG